MMQRRNCDEMYSYLENYIARHDMPNSAIALPLMKKTMAITPDRFLASRHYPHCLSISKMLIDLHFPFSDKEMDVIISTALCHVLPENLSLEESRKIFLDAGIDAYVPDTLDIMTHRFRYGDETYYDDIRNNRTMLFIKLADRADLMADLYGFDAPQAIEYINETRRFYYPLCEEAKVRFPECYGPICILLEKSRCLLDTAEILMNHFEEEKKQLLEEIELLEKENEELRTYRAL